MHAAFEEQKENLKLKNEIIEKAEALQREPGLEGYNH